MTIKTKKTSLGWRTTLCLYNHSEPASPLKLTRVTKQFKDQSNSEGKILCLVWNNKIKLWSEINFGKSLLYFIVVSIKRVILILLNILSRKE